MNRTSPQPAILSRLSTSRGKARSYTAAAGLLRLRERIAAARSRQRDQGGVANINCSVGGVRHRGRVAALVEPGDRSWYRIRPGPIPSMLSWAHGVLVPYPCTPANSSSRPERGERLITPKTRFDRQQPCNRLARSFHARCSSSWSRRATTSTSLRRVLRRGHPRQRAREPASFCTDGRVISAYTFSKTYVGWRVGCRRQREDLRQHHQDPRVELLVPSDGLSEGGRGRARRPA